MTSTSGPFATIESAQEFLTLLASAIDDATAEATKECSASAARHQERAVAAWQLVLYKMARLSHDVAHSRKVLDDVRTLRNLLRRTGSVATSDEPAPGAGPAVLWKDARLPEHRWEAEW